MTYGSQSFGKRPRKKWAKKGNALFKRWLAATRKKLKVGNPKGSKK